MPGIAVLVVCLPSTLKPHLPTFRRARLHSAICLTLCRPAGRPVIRAKYCQASTPAWSEMPPPIQVTLKAFGPDRRFLDLSADADPEYRGVQLMPRPRRGGRATHGRRIEHEKDQGPGYDKVNRVRSVTHNHFGTVLGQAGNTSAFWRFTILPASYSNVSDFLAPLPSGIPLCVRRRAIDHHLPVRAGHVRCNFESRSGLVPAAGLVTPSLNSTSCIRSRRLCTVGTWHLNRPVDA